MLRGDISNVSPPRFIITWDVLAQLPEELEKTFSRACRFRRWDTAVECWEIDRTMSGRMWLAEERYGIRWELVLFDLPVGLRVAVTERLDRENIPVANVSNYLTPQALAATLAYRPDVHAVVDIPDRGLYYGQRGLDPRSI